MQHLSLKRLSLSGQVSNLDLKLLHVFKTVVECEGFSAAEVELNIGRSAISRLMSDLETRLDMHLCERGRSGFKLTAQGQLVYASIQELLVDLEKFRANINAVHSRLVGELELGLTDNMITDPNCCLIDVIGLFHQREPEVKINLQIASPNEIERAVIEGRVNIGVIPYHHQLPGLVYQDLHQETSQLYCGARHPLFLMPDQQLDRKLLRDYDFIAPGYAHTVQLKQHFPELQTTATSYQMEGIATMILSGQYIGFLPRHYAAQWLDKQQMRSLLPEQMYYQVPFKVITRRDTQPNLLRNAFLQAVFEPREQSV